MLNRRLSDTDTHKLDILLYVVGILASIAVLFDDYDSAQMHAAGLSEIMRLRNKPGAINYNPVMELSVDRYMLLVRHHQDVILI